MYERQTDVSTLLYEIARGQLDDELNEVVRAIRARRQERDAAKVIGLRPRDRVLIGGKAPRHEHGGEMIVKWVNEKSVTVEASSPAFVGTRWARGRHVRVPLNWIGEVVR